MSGPGGPLPPAPWDPAPPPPDGDPATTDAFDEAVRAGRDPDAEQLYLEAQRLGRDPRFASLSDDEVVTELGSTASTIAAATARFLALVAELVARGVWAEQGARTPAQWLSWKLGVAPSTARQQLQVAVRLRTLPKVAARFAEGTLSYSKVRAITRVARTDDEDLLLEWADHGTAADLERIASATRSVQRRRFDSLQPDEDRRHRWRVRPHHDGTGTLSVTGPIEDIVALADKAERLAVVLVDDRDGTDGAAETAEETGGEDAAEADLPPAGPRVTAADRLEALSTAVIAAAAADTPVDTSGLDAHTLVLEADADALAALTAGPRGVGADASSPTADPSAPTTDPPAHLPVEAEGTSDESPAHAPADVVPVRDPHHRIAAMDRRVLRRLACEAGIRLVAMRDGSVVDVGRRSRRPSTPLRRALHRRDRGTCRFPGCSATRNLHAHHVVHWADGGPTDLDNLVLLCSAHHRHVHDHPVTIEVASDGAHTFRTGTSDGPPLEHAPSLPGVDGEVASAGSASAEALTPPGYRGDRFDLDLAVAALQQRYGAVGPLDRAA